MRLRHVLAVVVATGCGGAHLRRDVIGHGVATVSARGGQEVATPAGGLVLARGRYELALHFDIPHAQLVEYVVTCPNLTIPGRIGEPFEAYRTRRLAELRAKAERDRKNAAAITGAIVGAVAPDVHASGQATGPAGTATADANVSGQAVGAVAGEAVAQSMPEVTELPVADVGAGRLHAHVNVVTDADVTCSVTAIAEDANVVATYDVTHVRDLDAEARERQVAATAGARVVRGQLTAQLAIAGADPDGLAKRRAAEAQARAQAEVEARRLRAEADAERRRKQAIADAQRAEREAIEADARAKRQAIADAQRAEREAAEADARAKRQAAIDADRARAESERLRLQASLDVQAKLKISIELRHKQAALGTREYLIAFLAGECHADPHKRERERAELAAREEQRQLKIRLELDARMKLEAQASAERDARLAVEARLRAERDAKARLELDARLAVEARLRAEREAREAQVRAEREAREAKAAAERDARIALELEARRAREAENTRRIEVALSVRAELQASLVRIGARERPPMPALIAENPGSRPFDGAAWIAGHWQWTGGEWSWVAGGWRDTTTFGTSGSVGGAIVNIGATAATVVIDPPAYTDPSISVTADVPVSTTVRDHRTSDTPVVRDHRTKDEPTVRDHRTKDEPTVRDHRKDDDKPATPATPTTDTKPVVRDHRKH
jgi:hypothetical protein